MTMTTMAEQCYSCTHMTRGRNNTEHHIHRFVQYRTYLTPIRQAGIQAIVSVLDELIVIVPIRRLPALLRRCPRRSARRRRRLFSSRSPGQLTFFCHVRFRRLDTPGRPRHNATVHTIVAVYNRPTTPHRSRRRRRRRDLAFFFR